MNQTPLRRRSARWLLLALLLPVLGLACRSVVPGTSQPEAQALPAVVTQVVVTSPIEVSNEDINLVDLYTRVNPSVVNITIYVSQGGTFAPLGQGSGFVYDDQGHVVTNDHVVHGAEQIEVTFADGTTRYATAIGEDMHSDLAVIQVQDMPAGIDPLPLGDMSQIAVGQTVAAIGNPFGYSGTLTKGIISAMGRTIPALTQFSIPQSIQTDAAINPGNSGGPLLNMKGEVIGINAQIETDGTNLANSGVGFAIPVSIVSRVVPGLIADGAYDWAWLGVRGGDVSLDLVTQMNLTVDRGAFFSEITEGGPAQRAGMQAGDVATAINGQTVKSFDDLLVYIALETRPGDQVTLTIVRDDKTQEVSVTLGSRNDAP